MPYWTQQNLDLKCFPVVPEHVSLPWDAADDYLLQHINSDQTTLLFNDRHGALACALPSAFGWLESACSQLATTTNLAANQLASEVGWVDGEEALRQVAGDVQQVAIKIPKNLEQLTWWLDICAELLPHARIWLAGMSKHIPVRWLNWLESEYAEYQQLPQQRKARLICVHSRKSVKRKAIWQGYDLEQQRYEALPGVFCRDSLDPGARFMIETLAGHEQLADIHGQVCDLGCGNGVLGLWLKSRLPEIQLIQTDDSLAAVRSARHNATQLGLAADVCHGNSLAAVTENLDWVICNPPFHDGHKQLDNIAKSMFRDSHQQLTQNGRLLIVANRHLNYRAELARLFRQVELVASNNKFNVWLCAKQPASGAKS
ncbi:class I SAM-dependent methyltransferase [Oceanobacter mangrovi]|uniref:class I SAM-dependent methyltransferase n=1 Tax=Oceanobacter mangrovi TaxID=2862510 RepID=UPI001C8ECFBF|nr:methyltransferase [Oceanobacter mangrovi]